MKTRIIRSFVQTALLCLTISQLAGFANAQDAPKKADIPPAADKPALTKPAETPAAQTPAAAPAPTPPGTITYSGLVDWYLGINFRAPRSNAKPYAPAFTGTTTPSGEVIRSDNFGLLFNINDREPSFSLGEFNINRTEGKGFPFGITATLTVGDSARLYHANEPGGTSSWQTLHNLYLSKNVHVAGRDVEIDFGKWATPIGLEVLESSSNDNYSRGFDFVYGYPNYHAGVRAKLPLNSRISLEAAVVNGWNDVADDNNAKTVYAVLTLKPNPRLTANLSYIGGAEGTGAFGSGIPKDLGSVTVNLVDANTSYQITPKAKLAGSLTYGNASGSVNNVHESGDWLGMGGYARCQLTPKFAIAGRLEQFEDIPGVGGNGLRVGATGGYLKLRGATLTLEYTLLRDHLVSRLEYRHDHANHAVFGNGSGSGTPDQDTLYFSQVYKF